MYLKVQMAQHIHVDNQGTNCNYEASEEASILPTVNIMLIKPYPADHEYCHL